MGIVSLILLYWGITVEPKVVSFGAFEFQDGLQGEPLTNFQKGISGTTCRGQRNQLRSEPRRAAVLAALPGLFLRYGDRSM